MDFSKETAKAHWRLAIMRLSFDAPLRCESPAADAKDRITVLCYRLLMRKSTPAYALHFEVAYRDGWSGEESFNWRRGWRFEPR